MGITAFFQPFVQEVAMTREGEDMTPKPRKLAFILAAVLAVTAFITINAWTAAAKNENGWRALSAPGTIHRSGLVNLY
jgi:membrane-anchored glycerophosphoryl diester phosphodiesterase (GDPDase)